MKLPENMEIYVHGKKFKNEIPDNVLKAAIGVPKDDKEGKSDASKEFSKFKKNIDERLAKQDENKPDEQSGGVKKPDGNSEGNSRKRSE